MHKWDEHVKEWCRKNRNNCVTVMITRKCILCFYRSMYFYAVYWLYEFPCCGCRTSPCASVRQEKAFGGIFSTSSRLFSKWTESKVVPEFRGWHTPHCLTCLKLQWQNNDKTANMGSEGGNQPANMSPLNDNDRTVTSNEAFHLSLHYESHIWL